MSDEEQRIDPANVKRWWCSGAGMSTIVLATNATEARALAAFYFAKKSGKPDRPLSMLLKSVRSVHEANDEEVVRWLRLREQDQAGRNGARTSR